MPSTTQLGSFAQDTVETFVTNPLYFSNSVDAAALGLFITVFAGFKFFIPKELNVMSFQLSKYTYYNESIANSIVEQQPIIKLQAIRELNFINTYATNVITNNLMIKKLKEYSKNGGTFLLITPVGIINNLLLTDLSITFNNGNPNPVFNFTFTKLIVSSLSNSATALDARAAFCI